MSSMTGFATKKVGELGKPRVERDKPFAERLGGLKNERQKRAGSELQRFGRPHMRVHRTVPLAFR